MSRIGWVVMLTAVFAGPAAAQEGRRAFEVDDLFRLRDVNAPQVSPDGRWVAYTVTSISLEDNRRETRVWMAPMAGGDAIAMTMEGTSASSPRWSPDGRWLSFLASRDDEETQVWALDRRGGEARALTRVDQGVDSYAWSPDATRLLLSIDDPDPGTPPDSADVGDEDDDGDEDEDEPEPIIIDRLQFKRDYAGYLDRRRTHLYVWTLAGGTLTQITGGDYDEDGGEWSPDGRRVVFVSNRTAEPDANYNDDLWVVDVPAPGGAVPTPRRLTSNPGSDGSPTWSPDGRSIAYTTVIDTSMIWYATQHLAVIPAGGGDPRVLTAALDRSVYSPAFGPDGRIWFILEDSGEQNLARMRVDGRGLERVVSGERVVMDAHIGRTGDVALTISEPHLPAEVFALDGRGPRRITHVNDSLLAVIRPGAVRNIHFTSADGTEIEGWLTLPQDHVEGRRYPTLLRIHGGPVSQYDWGFELESQLFAAHGYVVVRANPRGSSGYGQAFSHAIWADWGNLDYQDVMAAVDHAVARGFADPDRLGVGGWSYGGILTNYVITQTDRFEAAITGASEVLYRSNYGHDHYQREWERELGLPWGETAQNWERISPFNRVENIVTPTLIMGGAEDWNVPILNSEQLYQALRRLGRPALLVVYPGEHHGIRRAAFQKDRMQRYLDWYDWFVKGQRTDLRVDWRGALPIRWLGSR